MMHKGAFIGDPASAYCVGIFWEKKKRKKKIKIMSNKSLSPLVIETP